MPVMVLFHAQLRTHKGIERHMAVSGDPAALRAIYLFVHVVYM